MTAICCKAIGRPWAGCRTQAPPKQRRTSLLVQALAPGVVESEETLTARIFKKLEGAGTKSTQAGGAGGATSYEALKRADAAWLDLRTRKAYGPKPEFVKTTGEKLPGAPQYDVLVCGGTLGIFLACALQLAGLRVAVVERGLVRGREQEWNIARSELRELVDLGVLTQEEVEACISSEFNPVRAGFHGSPDVWTRDVLNLGVRPDRLVDKTRQRFEGLGGRILESAPLTGIVVAPNGVRLSIGTLGTGSSSKGGASSSSSSSNGGHNGGGSDSGSSLGSSRSTVTAKLVLDCMGHASPIVRQVRFGQKPDGVCLVVGTCARGFPENTTGDIIYTFSPSQIDKQNSQPPSSQQSPGSSNRDSNSTSSSGTSSPTSSSPSNTGSSLGSVARPTHLQYFWEAFPAGSGPHDRTTYMFSYLDAHPDRPSLEALLEDYWRLMPQYQGVELDQLEILRVLFGCFPTHKESPLRPAFDRVLQVGDASGIQSPLSFGGFGALTRHLRRLTCAVKEAVEADVLDRNSLALINSYNPALSGAWMLQRAMSIPATARNYDVDFINKLLGGNFQAMSQMGEGTLKPFLQDVIQFRGLGQTMLRQLSSDLPFVPRILGHVGISPVLEWTLHFLALGLYTALDRLAEGVGTGWVERLPPKQRYRIHRTLDNWKYGAGADYHGGGS